MFRRYESEEGLTIRHGWIFNDVSLTIGRKRTVITYRKDLAPSAALLAVATMIEVLKMGWEGSRFRFRYPLPSDDREQAEATSANRRDYRQPERRAIRELLPDALLEIAERDEWEPWQLAEACGLDEATCMSRVRAWREARKPIISFAAFSSTVDMDGPIPF